MNNTIGSFKWRLDRLIEGGMVQKLGASKKIKEKVKKLAKRNREKWWI